MGIAIANTSISTIILAILDALDVGIMSVSFALTVLVACENIVVIVLINRFLLLDMRCALLLVLACTRFIFKACKPRLDVKNRRSNAHGGQKK